MEEVHKTICTGLIQCIYLIHFHPLVKKAYILQDRLKGLLNYNVVLMLLAFSGNYCIQVYLCSFIDMIGNIFKKLKK